MPELPKLMSVKETADLLSVSRAGSRYYDKERKPGNIMGIAESH